MSLSFLRYEKPLSRGVIKRTRHDTALRELIVVKGWIVNFTGDRQPRQTFIQAITVIRMRKLHGL